MVQRNWTAASSGTCMWRRVDWERVTIFSETIFSEAQISYDNQTVRRQFVGDKCRQLLWHLTRFRVKASPYWVSLLHSDTPHSRGLLCTSDQPDTHCSTWQHTTLTTDGYQCLRWHSNPQPQQASGRRPMPSTAWPLGPALRQTILIGVLLLWHINLSYSYFSPLYLFFSSSSFLFSPPPHSSFLPTNTGVASKTSRGKQEPYCNAITYFLLYSILAGVSGVARDDEWRNLIAFLP